MGGWVDTVACVHTQVERVGTRLVCSPPDVASAASTKAGEKRERCQSAHVAGAYARATRLSASGETVSRTWLGLGLGLGLALGLRLGFEQW